MSSTRMRAGRLSARSVGACGQGNGALSGDKGAYHISEARDVCCGENNRMKLLIRRGAGNIGSHTVCFAQDAGHQVIVLDNFFYGHRWAGSDCEVLEFDLLDQKMFFQSLERREFDDEENEDRN